MRILVTDGDTRPALAVTRALGRLGHDVVVAAERHPSLASSSRHCRGNAAYTSPQQQPDLFGPTIARIAAEMQVDVVIPVTEITTLLLAEARHLLPHHCSTPLPSTESIRTANDKSLVLEMARELGVPIPRTIVARSATDIADVGDLGYPVVLKPACSRVRIPEGWLSTGVSYAHDHKELSHRLASFSPRAFPVLLQERILGPGVGVFVCFQKGKPTALFSHRRLRERPPSGGVSVLCESAELDPTAVDYAVGLLSRLDWRGVAMVEFKRDDRDGTLRLMEINGRLWGSLQLAIDADVNFPAHLVSVATGVEAAGGDGYQIGVRSRWLAGDLDVLLMILRRSRNSLDLPASYPGKIRSMLRFLRVGRRNARLEIERADDWTPARLEWRRWLLGR